MEILVAFLSTLLLFFVPGAAVTWALLKGLKPRAVLAVGMMALGLYLAFGFLADFSGKPAEGLSTLRKSYDQMWQTRVQALVEQKVPQDQIDQEKVIFEKYFFGCLPAWSALLCLLVGLVSYYALSSLLSRATSRVSKPIAFKDWVVPDFLVFGLILGGLLKVFPFFQNHWTEVAADNLLVFFFGLYTLEGFSLVSFFLNRWRLSPAFRALSFATMVGYMFYYSDVFLTLCALGVLDVWFNFRKWKKTPLEQAP